MLVTTQRIAPVLYAMYHHHHYVEWQKGNDTFIRVRWAGLKTVLYISHTILSIKKGEIQSNTIDSCTRLASNCNACIHRRWYITIYSNWCKSSIFNCSLHCSFFRAKSCSEIYRSDEMRNVYLKQCLAFALRNKVFIKLNEEKKHHQ